MNELYTDLEQGYSNRDLNPINELEILESLRKANSKNMIDKINELFNHISRELGIRNLNNNIIIEIGCSEQDRERIFKEIFGEAEKRGIVNKISGGDVDKIKLSIYQSPLGKLKLVLNGK